MQNCFLPAEGWLEMFQLTCVFFFKHGTIFNFTIFLLTFPNKPDSFSLFLQTEAYGAHYSEHCTV